MNSDDLKVNILYVEDDEKIREGYARTLARTAKELYIAHNGEMGLELFAQHPMDIIVTDIKMPAMSGIDMIKEIRKNAPDISIIFTTAHNETDLLLEAIEMQAEAYLLKPVPIKRLMEKIGSISKRIVLEKINQEQRLQLEEYSKNLERMVEERTLELTASNQKLKELDTLKSMFIASMSHELRTPLNSIIGFTGVILQGLSGELNEKQHDQLTRVKKAGEHLLSLISDVIDISKIEAGRVESTPEVFLLSELLLELKNEMNIVAATKNLQIVINTIPPIQLYTDRRRLFQCLLNYVSNAIKFSDKAGMIEIKATDCGNEIELSVTDNGIGIKEENIPKLFEAFERLDSHLKVLAGGTGLGLYLTKMITQNLLLGDVYVKSVLGEGSTFGLRIPKELNQHGVHNGLEGLIDEKL